MFFSIKDSQIHIEALRDISKDEEITIPYLEKSSNFEFFMSYGFLYLPNCFDDVRVKIEIDPSETKYATEFKDLHENWHCQYFNLSKDIKSQEV